MALTLKKEIEYDHFIARRNSVEWSKDNRIALVTFSQIVVLELQSSVDQLNSELKLVSCSIPYDSPPYNMSDMNREQYLQFAEKAPDIVTEQELALDPTLGPLLVSQSPLNRYKTVKWSPLGGDHSNRSILATLSCDHRVAIVSCGDSRDRWSEVCCLSDVYKEHHQIAESAYENKYAWYKEKMYATSVEGIAWSNTTSRIKGSNSAYAVLACAMKNGDLVLWKVVFPATDRSCVSMFGVLKGASPNTFVSHMTWASRSHDLTDHLLLCTNDGAVSLKALSLEDGGLVASVTVEEADEIAASCSVVMDVPKVKNTFCVVVAKGVFVMTYLVNFAKGAYSVLYKNHITIENYTRISGLAIHEDSLVLCTESGNLFRGPFVINTGNNSVTLDPKPLTTKDKWKHSGMVYSGNGVALSPNGIFMVYTKQISTPLLGHEQRTKLEIFQFVEEEPLKEKMEQFLQKPHEADDSFLMVDLIEVFREHIWEGRNLIPSISIYLSLTCNWYSLPMPVLHILIIFLSSITPNIPDDQHKATEKEKEELHGNRDNLRAVKKVCVMQYVLRSLTAYTKLEDPSHRDKQVQSRLSHWMSAMLDSIDSPPMRSDYEQLLQLMPEVADRDPSAGHVCPICTKPCHYTRDVLTVACADDHYFMLCCQTMQLCDADYRVCLTCKTLAVPMAHRQDLTWLITPSHQCAVCGGPLLPLLW